MYKNPVEPGQGIDITCKRKTLTFDFVCQSSGLVDMKDKNKKLTGLNTRSETLRMNHQHKDRLSYSQR